MTRWAAAIAVVAAIVSLPATRAQQAQKADAEYLRKAYDSYRSMAGASSFRSIPWQYLGPTNISGRATDIAVADRGGARRIYAAYATSGVWKTDDNGATWQPIFEQYASTSIGDLAVAPSNPDIVWVGTGEANLFRASMAGAGVYKSTDAGRTFAHAGLTDTQTISRIVVHPTNPDTVYLAASGHEWTDNETRGVFKTTDGGRTWTKVFYRSPRTGAIDLVMDPSEPETLYAAMWQRVRRKWSDPRVESGYDEGGVWKTTDGGKTWIDASAGLPAAQFRGRIGLDVSRSNPNVLYAFVDNYDQGRPPREGERDAYTRPIFESRIKSAEIYRSDDKGKSWRKVTENNDYMMGHSGTYGWVFGQIRVDPTDENTIYTLGLALNVSRDAGKTFSELRGMHGDHHGLWIDPANPSILYDANDGGLYRSSDAGKTWTYDASAGGVQFYNVTLDTSTPVWAYGSVQDYGSRRGTVDMSKGRENIPAVAWSNAPGGEGSNHAVDPTNNDIIYSHGFYGNFTREDLSQRTQAARGEGAPAQGQGQGRGRGRPGVTNIRPPAIEGGPDLRAQWMAPVIASKHDPATIYTGFQFVFRSTNRGDAWERISPDLSSNDPSQMLLKSSSAIPYQTIVALAESPQRANVLYAGTDDGKLHVTMDLGKTWTELTKSLPSRKWISRIEPSRHTEGTLFVSQRGREDDDFAPYVYKSTDNGKTFTSIAANLPAGPVNVIREDPVDPNTLYVGTDFGAFVSTNGGRDWQVLGSNLPSTQVSDLQVHPRDHVIVISTYGRGMWAMDALKVRAVR
ncbi:MAG TPA: hypothetical protein VH740_15190 [Vicinamibacterales bacterium]|jgi:photosystem II stability/assembly factor-like uncharacterized protein